MSLALICSRAVTRRRALPWTLLRFPTCGVAVAVADTLWPGMAESSTHEARVMTTLCPITGQAGGAQSQTSSAVSRRDGKPARPARGPGCSGTAGSSQPGVGPLS